MATIVTKAGKGGALTSTEMDDNFTNLNTDKLEAVALTTFLNTSIKAGVLTGTTSLSLISTEQTSTAPVTYEEMTNYRFLQAGTYNFSWNVKTSNATYAAYSALHLNGVSQAPTYTATNSATYLPASFDLTVAVGDTVQLMQHAHATGGNTAYTQDFVIKADADTVIIPPIALTIGDR